MAELVASRLELRLLGSPQVALAHAPLSGFVTSKAEALLYYLAVTGQMHTRTALAALLWPDATDSVALKNLRDIIFNLRKLLGEHLIVTRQTMMLQVGAQTEVDVARLRAYLQPQVEAATVSQLQSAIALYGGDLLDGFYTRDAAPFEEWLLVEREQLRLLVSHAMHRLVAYQLDAGAWHEGLQITQRLLALDSWDEAAHRQQMRLLVASGQRGAALAQYEHCYAILQAEFGIEPTQETQALYRSIQSGDLDDNLRSSPSLSPANNHAEALLRLQRDLSFVPQHPAFVGRQVELQQLDNAVRRDHKRLLAVVGLGGQGKSALVAQYVTELCQMPLLYNGAHLQPPTPLFQRVLWCSCQHAPSLNEIVTHWLQQLSVNVPTADMLQSERLLQLLFTHLRQEPVIFVLENFESFLTDPVRAGVYRQDSFAIEDLLERFATAPHQSVLILTSREQPLSLVRFANHPTVSVIQLDGMTARDATLLLQQCQLDAPPTDLRTLATRYAGNPLALKIVAEMVNDLFASDLAAFLQEETLIVDDIRLVLEQQVARLSPLELEIMLWLAIEREAITPQQLWNNMVQPQPRNRFYEALHALQRRFLIETVEAPKRFTGQVAVHLSLQPIVLEYMTSYLVSAFYQEIETEEWDLFQRYLLVKAQAPDYVRQIQRRLLLQPLLDNLALQWGKQRVEQRLLRLLPILHERVGRAPGYAAANLLHLLIALDVDLQGLNFSRLSIWQADLRRVHLKDVNFADADLNDSAFAEYFGGVTATCFSADNRLLAAATTDGNIYLWNTEDGHLVGICRGSSRWAWSVAITADGQTLAAGYADKLIRLWDIGDLSGAQGRFLHTTMLLRTLQGHDDTVFAVAFNADGTVLVSGGGDGKIHLWQVRTGALIATQSGHTAGITAIAVAPTHQPKGEEDAAFQYASAGKDGQVQLWSSTALTPLRTLRAQTARLFALAFHPDGATLFAGGADQTILRWSVTTGAVLQRLTAVGHQILSLACTTNTLAAGTGEHKICLWDLQTGKLQTPLTGHTDGIQALAFAGNHILVSGSFDQTIRLWDLQRGHPIRIHYGCRNRILALALQPHGRLLADSSMDGVLTFWQVPLSMSTGVAQTAVEPAIVAHRLSGTIRALHYHPDGLHMVSIGDDGLLRLWAVDDHPRCLTELTPPINDLLAVAISPNGEWLASGGESGKIALIHFGSRRCLQVATVSTAAVQVLVFTPDGQQLLCGCADGRVVICELAQSVPTDYTTVAPAAATGPLRENGTHRDSIFPANYAEPALLRAQFALHSHCDDLFALAISPDGRWVAVGGSRSGIELWELATQQRVNTYCTPSSIFTLAFSPNGTCLAAGGGGHFFAIWDLATQQMHQPVSEQQGVVRQLLFAADSQQIFTCGDDETVRLWQLDNGSWQQRALLRPPSLYSGLNIYGATGINGEQQQALRALGAIEQISMRVPNRQQHNIPAALTPLYGRMAEVEALISRLLDDGTRIVTLVGEGGVGKTHLSLEVARVLLGIKPLGIKPLGIKPLGIKPLGIKPLGNMAAARDPLFTDGVWLVALASVPADERRIERLINMIAGVLNLTFHQQESPQQQLFAHLRSRRLLLILDNFDLFSQETDFLLALLMAAPYVKLLLTSRNRLDLFAQIVHSVHGLAMPTAEAAATAEPEDLLHYAAIQLFVEQANRLTGAFELNGETRDQVLRICQFMHGLPLGIKLAAAQLAHYPLPEVVSRIQHDLSLLTANAADLPAHQRSLQTVLTQSWSALPPRLAHGLAGCAVFAGSFDLATAVAVTATTGTVIEDLAARSLLHVQNNSRYILHEFVSTFLQQQPAAHAVIAQAQARHAAHYAQLLDTKGRRKQNNSAHVQQLAGELTEINRAWQWALEQLDLPLLQQGVEGIFFLYECLGQFPEARYLLNHAATVIQQHLADLAAPGMVDAQTTLAPATNPHAVHLRVQQAKGLLAEISFYSGLINEMMGDLSEAQRAANRVIALGRTLNNPRHEARGYYLLALQGQQRAQFAQATKWIMRAAQLAERNNLVDLQITAANLRGVLYDMQGDHQQAIEQYQQVLPLALETQDRFQERLLVNNLGIVALSMGDWEAARTYLERNLALSNESGNAGKQTYALMNYGLLLNALGLYDQARQHLLQGLQLAHTVGHRQSEVYLLIFLAQNCFYSGYIGIGVKYAEEALQRIDEHQFHSLKAAALATLGHNLLATEELTRALACYTESIALWRAMNNHLEIGTSLAGQAYVQLRSGQLAQALATIEELLTMLDAILSENAAEAIWVVVVCYFVLQEAHDERRVELLQKGHRYLLQQAECIKDPEVRTAFLKNVYAHRFIVHAARTIS